MSTDCVLGRSSIRSRTVDLIYVFRPPLPDGQDLITYEADSAQRTANGPTTNVPLTKSTLAEVKVFIGIRFHK